MSVFLPAPRVNPAVECDEIEKGLCLGNLQSARCERTLADRNITHILCAFIYPVEYPKHIKSLFIDVDDSYSEAIITHFDRTNKFIEEGQKKGSCLVHCFAGVSRSVTLVVAYLMQKYKISVKEALKMVRDKHYPASPNFGFQAQLELYESMQYTLNKHNRRYRLLLLQKLRNEILTAPDFSAISEYTSSFVPKMSGDKFKCRRCRHYLFSEENVLRHNQGCSLDWKNNQLEENPSTCVHDDVIFIELLGWMTGQVSHPSGELCCSKCSAKLGSFSWSSHACQCGGSIQPSFKIVSSNVDRERTLQL